jgi:hypothetical protein
LTAIETRDLADSKADVGMSVSCKVKKHADNRRVQPSLLHGSAIGIHTKSKR